MNSGGPQIVSQLDARIFTLAEAAGVDRDELIECLASGEMSQVVEADSQNALETGGRGTPWSIVIGPNGTYPINGALPPEAVNQILDAARSGAELPVDPEAPELNTDAVTPLSDTDYRKGPADATLTIVEYSDFDCTFCSRFHSSMQQVINTNDDVAWVYRHFPLDQIHPDARRVAEASECVGALGGDEAFWSFTDGYFGV
jgi:protein-disulfide isomerase